MRSIDKIILHCSASDRACDDNIETIDRWHRERGFTGVGYHFVITRDGKRHIGRQLNVTGAHCLGQNANSIGICLTGNEKFSEAQFEECRILIRELFKQFGILPIHGHCEFANKLCPNFDYKNVIISKL